MRLSTVLASFTAIFLTSTVNAEGLDVEPGQWEMTTTMTMSMMPQPQVTTDIECIEEDKLRPEDFDMDEDSPCSISDVNYEGNTGRWSIDCPVEGGGAMKGQWEVTSNGDKLSGKGEMTPEIAGQKMGFNMSWEGKRIGECK